MNARPHDGLRFFHLPIFRPPSPSKNQGKKGAPHRTPTFAARGFVRFGLSFPRGPFGWGRAIKGCEKLVWDGPRLGSSITFPTSTSKVRTQSAFDGLTTSRKLFTCGNVCASKISSSMKRRICALIRHYHLPMRPPIQGVVHRSTLPKHKSMWANTMVLSCQVL